MMATLSKKRPNIQFRLNGRRRTLSVAQLSYRDRMAVRVHVGNLVSAREAGRPAPADTYAWLNQIGADLHKKLVKLELVEARKESAPVQLGAFIDGYVARRTDLKPWSVKNFTSVGQSLKKFFGVDRDLRTITPGEAADWKRKAKETVAAATISNRVKKARQMFKDAVDRKLITENPFAGMKAGSQANESRLEYVPVPTILKVIEACPDAEWRLIFALARFAGLRTPSETAALVWSDVQWQVNRFIVRSPKTEHNEGCDKRTVPIFPELLPYLRDVFEAAEPGTKHVITRHRGENLRTQAERIIERSGVSAWGKIFQNLRSSCETDLASRFPLHVACAWIGNSETIAKRHYLQVTEDHFSEATEKRCISAAQDAQNGAKTPKADSVKPAGNMNNGGNHCTEQDSHANVEPSEIQQAAHEALQRALHGRLKDHSRRGRREAVRVAGILGKGVAQ